MNRYIELSRIQEWFFLNHASKLVESSNEISIGSESIQNYETYTSVIMMSNNIHILRRNFSKWIMNVNVLEATLNYLFVSQINNVWSIRRRIIRKCLIYPKQNKNLRKFSLLILIDIMPLFLSCCMCVIEIVKKRLFKLILRFIDSNVSD